MAIGRPVAGAMRTWWAMVTVVCLGVVLAPRPGRAQTVQVPTFVAFNVSGTFRQSVIATTDVAVGRDGIAVIVADDISHAMPPYGSSWFTRLFTQAGTPLPPPNGGGGQGTSPRLAAAELPLLPGSTEHPGLVYAVAAKYGASPYWQAMFLDATGKLVPQPFINFNVANGPSLGVAMKASAEPVFVTSDDVPRLLGIDFFTPFPDQQFTIMPVDPLPFVDVAPLADGGYLVVWGADQGARPPAEALRFTARAIPGTTVTVSADTVLRDLAVNPTGTEIAMVGTRPRGAATPNEIWAVRLTPDGAAIGSEFLAYAASPGTSVAPEIEYDILGNLYVVWSEGGDAIRARGFDAANSPASAAVTLGSGTTGGDLVRAARFPDGSLMNAWVRGGEPVVRADVVSLCSGTAVCGDGTYDPFCERCDDPIGNSDTVPDRCRTDCEPAHCGDGVTDGGEECDDGNGADCDGCSAGCRIEVGLACGDGIAFPSCGQTCDDANAIDGDGCATDCTLERIPGGGGPRSDCYTEWVVDNPANDPRLDKRGRFSARQTCTDDDPRCDFDGGVGGGCTFHVRMCANNRDIDVCEPSLRLATWTLSSPSAAKALHDPALAAARAAVTGVVPATIVGPSDRDICSPFAEVRVLLRTNATGPIKGRLKLKTRATLYSGDVDKDGLDLECLPSG